MKNSYALFLFLSAILFFPLKTNAQTWLHDNHIWQFDVEDFWPTDPNGLYEFQIIKDTVFQGIDCKILASTTENQYAEWIFPRTIAYEEGEAVYAYNDWAETFFKIYDFSLKIGDTLFIDQNYFYVIVETGSMQINSGQRRFQSVLFSNWAIPSLIIEGMGLVGDPSFDNPNFCAYFFLNQDFCTQAVDGWNIRFRCFNDGLNLFSPFSECTLTPISEAVSNPINIYPNPTTNSIFFDLPNGILADEIYITNQFGIRKNMEYSNSQINLSELPIGIYFISIKLSSGHTHTEKIIVSK